MMHHRTAPVAERYYTLIDTGSYYNFILRSVVERLDLTIYDHGKEVTELLNDIGIQTREYVIPAWQFCQGQKQHQNFKFFIVNKIPNNFRVLVGGPTAKILNISLRAQKSALVAHPTGGVRKGSCIPFVTSVHWVIKVTFHVGQKSPAETHYTSQVRENSKRLEERQKVLDQKHADSAKSYQQKASQSQASNNQVCKEGSRSQTK